MAAIKKKWVFACVSTIVFITSFLETMMVILYKNFLIAGNILAIFGTTVDEGTGFIAGTIHALPWTIPCIIFYALALYLHREQKLKFPCPRFHGQGISYSLVLFGMA